MDKELKKLVEAVIKVANYKGLSEKEKKQEIYDTIHTYGEKMYERGHSDGLEEIDDANDGLTDCNGYTLADIYGD